jgi:hypothetical protein
MRLYVLFQIIARHARDPSDKVAKYRVVRCILDAIREGYLEITDDVQSVFEDLDIVEAYIAAPDRLLDEPERHLKEILDYPEVAIDDESEYEDDPSIVLDAPAPRMGNMVDTLILAALTMNTITLTTLVMKLIFTA